MVSAKLRAKFKLVDVFLACQISRNAVPNPTRAYNQVRAMSSKPKVIAVGPWSPGKLNAEGEYKDSTAHVDRAMREVAAEESLQYRSVSDIATRPDTHGWGTSPGVKWHPNDLGHSMYADRLFGLYKAVEK